MIAQASLELIERALNAALWLDRDICEKWAPCLGHTLKIHIVPPDVCVWLFFTENGIRLLTDVQTPAQATLRSHPILLVRLGLSSSQQARYLFNQGVHLEGDIEFAQHVQALFKTIEFDWEEHLSRLIGDMAAYRLSTSVKRVHTLAQRVALTLAQQCATFLQEEALLVPTTSTLNGFYDEVDEVTLAVARLEAKLKL